MIVDNNVIHFDFKKASMQNNEKGKPISKAPLDRGELQPIPIETLRAEVLRNNAKTEIDSISDIIQDLGYTPNSDKIYSGLQKYYQSAVEFKDVKKDSEDFIYQVEEDFKNLDTNLDNKILNLYGDGTDNKKRQRLDYEDETYYIPSEKSFVVMTELADRYIKTIQEQFPKYSFELETEETSHGDPVNKTITIRDDKKSINFNIDDFISSIRNKKIEGDIIVSLPSKDDENSIYVHHVLDGLVEKQNTVFNVVTDGVLVDEFNKDGKPNFYIDEDFLSGPIFYVRKEYNSDLYNRFRAEEAFNILKELSPEEKNRINSAITSDENAQDLKKSGVFPQLIISCFRDGKFNPNVAVALSYLTATMRTEWQYGYTPQNYLNEIISIVENDDHTFEYDTLDIARELLTKEKDSLEDYHETVLDMLNFLVENEDDDDINYVIQDLALSEELSIYEVEELFLILKEYINGDSELANGHLQAFAIENSDIREGFDNTLEFYREFLLPFSEEEN